MSPAPFMTHAQVLQHLRSANAIARRALDAGHHPFGALLVARMLATPQRQEEVLNASRRLLDRQLASGN